MNKLVSVLALLALAAPGARAETRQARDEAAPLFLTRDDEARVCVGTVPGSEVCHEVPLPAEFRGLYRLADGWLAVGETVLGPSDDEREELLLLRFAAGRIQRLAPPRPARTVRRGQAVAFVSDGRLDGLAWLQGSRQEELEVWEAGYGPGGWSKPRRVAANPGGSQVALTGAVLRDGSRLLAWTAFDGTDDDTVWSLDRGRGWSPPRLLHEGNDAPDALPEIVPHGDGALASWSRLVDRHYRVLVARFDGTSWAAPTALPSRGAVRTGFTRIAGDTQLAFLSTDPRGWTLVELGEDGAPNSSSFTPTPRLDRPVVLLGSAGPELAWPHADTGHAPARPDAGPSEGASDEFRYLAFGDSVTHGHPAFDECSPDGEPYGYPGRLPPAIGCGAGCEVVNGGLGGEDTAMGLTRIQQGMDAAIANGRPYSVILLMEGTNDICFRGWSNNTVQTNLGLMEEEARDRDAETLHASIIRFHPGNPTHGGALAGQVQDMRARVRDNLANVDPDTGHRWWADPWTPLCPTGSCFNAHYNPSPPDPVGHPDCSGFDILTDVFADAILARGLPGEPTLNSPVGVITDPEPSFNWNKEIPRDASWYQVQLDGPGGNLHDAWYEKGPTCQPWSCSLDLGALPDGDYTWRVRGRNPAGRSAWVEEDFSIVTILPPGFPTLTAPTGYIAEDRPAFEWQREDPALADEYRVEIHDDGGGLVFASTFGLAVCSHDGCSVSPFALGDPMAPGAYTWRVQGSNAAGPGPWPAPLSFVVEPDLVFFDGFESGDVSAWDSSAL